MKAIFIIGFLLSTVVSFSQEWRDPLGLARKEYKNENYEKALKYYKSAQKKAPEDVNLSDEIGQSAYKSGDYETAEKVFQQNSANKRSNKNRAKNIHNIGNARMRTKNYKGAVEAYKDALRLNPEDEKTRYNLSEATRKLKKKKKEKEKSQKNQDEKKKEKPKSEEKKDDNDTVTSQDIFMLSKSVASLLTTRRYYVQQSSTGELSYDPRLLVFEFGICVT